MPEEITAEYAVRELNQNRIPSVRIRTTIACKTDLGRVRENNEDKFEFLEPENPHVLATKGSVYVVCDGMGGHNAGQIASELAMKTFLDSYFSIPGENVAEAASYAIKTANRYVRDVGLAIPSRKGMGTTFSGLIIREREAYIVQVGDSRVYRLRDGTFEQLSEEHTWVNEVVQKGLMSAEEAQVHPYKNVITRAIGTEADVEPQVRYESVEEGDIYLLCSDGLTNHVSDSALEYLLKNECPGTAVWQMVNDALTDGGSDNCTALVVRVDTIICAT